ncbi:uncharacterized protein B0H64DRAFT_79778 [Chaetomium fimeti]|uniref:Uncharacterized protein n=1 Tax=Chaetomium fimeti TaxID=1854472 RepID=A0AAE0LUX3_9PEZI|nr:hypothetical protein B0H64DRAFT_79778 [Chaetomium fimeti]
MRMSRTRLDIRRTGVPFGCGIFNGIIIGSYQTAGNGGCLAGFSHLLIHLLPAFMVAWCSRTENHGLFFYLDFLPFSPGAFPNIAFASGCEVGPKRGRGAKSQAEAGRLHGTTERRRVPKIGESIKGLVGQSLSGEAGVQNAPR